MMPELASLELGPDVMIVEQVSDGRFRVVIPPRAPSPFSNFLEGDLVAVSQFTAFGNRILVRTSFVLARQTIAATS